MRGAFLALFEGFFQVWSIVLPSMRSLRVEKFRSYSLRTARWFIDQGPITMSKISRLVRREIEYERELDSTKQSHLPTIVDCQRHFGHLRGSSR